MDVEGVQLRIFSNGINYARVPSFQKMTLDIAHRLRAFIIEFYEKNPGNFCNIIEFELNADIDPNAREWGANRPSSITSVSDAFVIRGMAHRMLANFYLKMNRPQKPTKFFATLAEAINWSLEQLEKRNEA